jgi:hypothetical protein
MAVKVPTQVPRPSIVPTTPDHYWLARCEGYRVVSKDGHVGTVFGVRFDPGTGELAGLRVRTGLLRRHLLIVPITDVLGLEPRRRLIYVRDGAATLERVQVGERNGRSHDDHRHRQPDP